MHSDLQGLIDQLKSMLDRFEEPTTAAAPHLSVEDRATTRSLLREAKALLDESLGRLNEFSTALLEVLNEPAFGIYNPPTREKLLEGIAAIEAGLRQMRRKQTTPATPFGIQQKPSYVAQERITELQSIPAPLWDTSAFCAWFRNSIRRMLTICIWLQPCFCAPSATTFPRFSTRRTSGRLRTTLWAGPSAVILSTSIAL